MQTTRVVQVGTVSVGGDAPVSVQSMTNTDTRDVEATVRQILALESAGCDIVRASVYDRRCAESFSAIREGSISRLLQTCILTIALLF